MILLVDDEVKLVIVHVDEGLVGDKSLLVVVH